MKQVPKEDVSRVQGGTQQVSTPTSIVVPCPVPPGTISSPDVPYDPPTLPEKHVEV